MSELETIKGHVVRVHDGDTFTVEVQVRLRDCNARELAEPGGTEARDHLRMCLENVGSVVTLYGLRADPYGRVDAFVQAGPIADLGEYLAARQWVARYPGHGPKVNPPWPRTIPS